jgi:glycosyltransferase involved in cell wall biosynthesis
MKPRIKVLHLIDSGGLYGAENVVINLSSGLNANDCPSIIGGFIYRDKAVPEIVTKARSLGLETALFSLKNKFDLTCTKRIAAYYKSNEITLIHSHGYKPSLICLLLKIFYDIPYVITCHLWYINNIRLRIYTIIERFCMLFAKKVIGVSEEIVWELRKAGVPEKKLRVIDNGIDIRSYTASDYYDERALRASLGLKMNSFIIGSLGRLTEQKCYKNFLLAAAELLKEKADLEFLIAGDGELKEELLSLSEALHLQNSFHFLGFRNDKINILRLMDIFILSSLDEGLPMAMLEAMAMRLPVVVTRVGGIPKLIKHGENGLLIERNDYMQLKESLLLLINDDQILRALGENAYETVRKKYSNEIMMEKYKDIYNEVIGSR